MCAHMMCERVHINTCVRISLHIYTHICKIYFTEKKVIIYEVHACTGAKLLQRVRLCVTLWTVAHQAPLSMEFSRQEYWSGLPCHPPEDLPGLGTKPTSLTSNCIGKWILYC